MGDSHYYDKYIFTSLLKDTLGSTSIIYKYDPDHTPIASANSSYHTSTDLSYIQFHNQIFSVDMVGSEQQYITHADGKSEDVSLNIYIDGKHTGEEVSTNISNIPFIGNYSEQTVWDKPDIKVLDLFQYSPKTFTFVPLVESDLTYTDARFVSNTEYQVYAQEYTLDVDFKYENNKWILYTRNPSSYEFESTDISYLPPSSNYTYNRIDSYKYPDINVNNILTSRGTVYPNPKNITTELILP